MNRPISPLPWRVNDDYGTFGNIEAADGRQVAQAQQVHPRDKDLKQVERRANAAFIVHAVNNHDQLVSAVQAQHEAIDILMARLIELDPKFKPSESRAWPALMAGKSALEASGAK